MAILTFSGGTANATYTPPAGWTSYDSGFVFSDATSIKNASATFGVILNDALSGGTLTSKISFVADSSGAPIVGIGFMTPALSGFIAQIAPASDTFTIALMTSGVDGTVLASGAISTFTSMTDGNPYDLWVDFNAGTNSIVFKLAGVTLASTTYTGGVSALRGGTACYNNTNNKITAIEVSSGTSYSIDTLTTPIPLGSTGNTINTTGLGTLSSLTIGGVSVSSLSATGGDGTFSAPAWADGVVGLLVGTGQTVIAGDGTNTATVSTGNVTAPSGNSTVILTSVNTSTAYLGGQMSLSVGDQIMFPTAASLSTATNYIDVDGGIYTTFTGTQVIYKRSVSTGVVTRITLINGVVASSKSVILWMMGF